MLLSLITTLFASVFFVHQPEVSAQDLSTNGTGLFGTWSSGSGRVLTGAGFANPVNFSFTYPLTTGIAYSFTDDGAFEEAQYRFVANGSEPHCVKTIVIWQHGTYTIHTNNSITMVPIAADGRIQVQDPCAATTSTMYYYDQWELYNGWTITNDINHNAWMLQLYRFDGSLMPRLYLVERPPSMLPTTQLTTNQTLLDQSDINTGSVNTDSSGTNQGTTASNSTSEQGTSG